MECAFGLAVRDATHMSSSTLAKLSSNQAVALSALEKICAELECNIGDIMEFTNLDEVREEFKKNR